MDNQGVSSQGHILTGQTERIASVNPSTLLRILSKVTVAATFLLLLAGALVTGNKAAMSDPTWPKFVGHWIPQYFQGGLRYEDSHRIAAATVGILTLILALVIQFNDQRRFMKKLGWSALLLVIVQALFGALIIKSIRHPAVSMAHACIAQAFFCVTIAIAVFSSRTWFQDLAAGTVLRAENKSYLKLMKFMVLVVFFQVVMGTGVRHSNDSTDLFLPFLLAHIAGAFAVIITTIWFTLRTYHVYRDITPLRRTALWALGIVVYQIVFGILSIFANRARQNAGLPELHHVIVSTGHLLGGATLLALIFGNLVRASHFLETDTSMQNTEKTYQSHEVNA